MTIYIQIINIYLLNTGKHYFSFTFLFLFEKTQSIIYYTKEKNKELACSSDTLNYF